MLSMYTYTSHIHACNPPSKNPGYRPEKYPILKVMLLLLDHYTWIHLSQKYASHPQLPVSSESLTLKRWRTSPLLDQVQSTWVIKCLTRSLRMRTTRLGKVNRGNSEYTFKKIVRLHMLLTIIEPFYARGFLTLRTTSSISLIASRLRSRPRGHNILSYAEIT